MWVILLFLLVYVILSFICGIGLRRLSLLFLLVYGSENGFKYCRSLLEICGFFEYWWSFFFLFLLSLKG